MYNPVTRSYGEPHKRPEVQNATVEFIASSDYMVRCFCLSTRGQSWCYNICRQIEQTEERVAAPEETQNM